MQTQHGVCACGVMVKALDCGVVVSEFKFQLHYYVHFQTSTFGKGISPLILTSYGLNGIAIFAVVLAGWLWHWITHED